MMWFISRSLGFLLESIVMSIILHMVGPMENLMENTIAQVEQIAGETQTDAKECCPGGGRILPPGQ